MTTGSEKEKKAPAKKKAAILEQTSAEFIKERETMDYSWLLTSVPEQWVLGKDKDVKMAGAYGKYYQNKNLLDLCYVMDVQYQILAERDYVQNRDPKRARGFWYLSAFSWLCAYQLREKGYSVVWVPYFEMHESGRVGHQPVFSKMLCAYASGEEWMVPEIHHFSSEVEKERTNVLLQCMLGKQEESMIGTIEGMEKDFGNEALLAVLRKDSKEMQKLLVKKIRQDRRQYKQCKVMIDFWAYGFLRLAISSGMEIEPIIAAEVLDGDLECESVDKEYFKLPYEEEILQILQKR